jgi:hypothetical protein
MRALLISGLVLIAIGLWIIIRTPSYSRDETVLKFGDIEAKMQQQRSVPEMGGRDSARCGDRDRPSRVQEKLIPGATSTIPQRAAGAQ